MDNIAIRLEQCQTMCTMTKMIHTRDRTKCIYIVEQFLQLYFTVNREQRQR